MKLKSGILALLMGIVVLFISGCDMTGADGKAYLTITNGSAGVSLYASVVGFPDNWTLGNPYEITEGTGTVYYAMSYQEYNATISKYECYINSSDYYYESATEFDQDEALYYYLYDDVDGGSVYELTFDIEVKKGEDGSLFKKGDDGADTQYAMTLYWNPDNITITSSGADMAKSIVTENGVSTIQFSDEYRIFTLTIPETREGLNAKEAVPYQY